MRGVFSKGRPLASPVSWTGIYGFFLLTVFILWVPSSGYQNIVWPKHLLFLWATALFVLGLVPMVLIQKARQSLPRRWTGADRLPLCLAAGLLLLFLLSALASPYPDVVWLGNRRYEGFLTLALHQFGMKAFYRPSVPDIDLAPGTPPRLLRLHHYFPAKSAGN